MSNLAGNRFDGFIELVDGYRPHQLEPYGMRRVGNRVVDADDESIVYEVIAPSHPEYNHNIPAPAKGRP